MIETLAVTGSNIRRTDIETALPLQIITREDIERSGAIDAAALLSQVSANLIGRTDAIFIGNPQARLSSANLRGLGEGSTLVLLNGRRAANYAANGGTVNLNFIPVAAIVTPSAGEASDVFWAALRRGLRERGWVEGKNIILEFRDADFSRLPSAANEMVALNVDVILAAGSLAALAAKKATDRIPIVFWADDPVGRGIVASLAQLSYADGVPDVSRQVAIYVDKILPGARPADLPVEQPMAFDLAINLKTAKALGITIPRELLVRADRIVE